MFAFLPFGLIFPFFIIGILAGIALAFAGFLVSYTKNFWFYFKVILEEENRTFDSIKIDEIDKGYRVTKKLGRLLIVLGIVLSVLSLLVPIGIIVFALQQQ